MYRNYMCLWPDKTCTFAQAENKAELREILDEVADPGSVMITEYKNPIAFELNSQFPTRRKSEPSKYVIVKEESIGADLSGLLFLSDKFSDVSLRFDNAIFPAHKCILASRSMRFNAMFSSNFIESTQSVIDLHPSAENCTSNDISALLYFIYSDKHPSSMPNPKENNDTTDSPRHSAKQRYSSTVLLALADEFELARLKHMMEVEIASSGVFSIDYFDDDGDESSAELTPKQIKTSEMIKEKVNECLNLFIFARLYSAPQLASILLHNLVSHAYYVKRYCLDRLNSIPESEHPEVCTAAHNEILDLIGRASSHFGKISRRGERSSVIEERAALRKDFDAFRDITVSSDPALLKNFIDHDVGLNDGHTDNGMKFVEAIKKFMQPNCYEMLEDYYTLDQFRHELEGNDWETATPEEKAEFEERKSRFMTAIMNDVTRELDSSRKVRARTEELTRLAGGGDMAAAIMLRMGVTVPVLGLPDVLGGWQGESDDDDGDGDGDSDDDELEEEDDDDGDEVEEEDDDDDN